MPHKANPVLSVADPPRRPHHPAARRDLAPLPPPNQVDERADGAWHAEWDTLRTLLRRTAVPRTRRPTCSRVSRCIPIGWRPPCRRRTTTCAPSSATMADLAGRPAGRGLPRRAPPRSSRRRWPARPGSWPSSRSTARTRGDRDPQHHRRPDDRRPAPGGAAAARPRALARHLGRPPCWVRRRAAGLTDAFDVVAWDLPGHGHNRAGARGPFTVAELAAGVLASSTTSSSSAGAATLRLRRRLGRRRGRAAAPARRPRPGRSARRCAAPAPGSATRRCGPAGSGQVSASGTAVAGDRRPPSAGSAPGFLEREPERGSALLHALQDADRRGLRRRSCARPRRFDVRDRLGEIAVPGARGRRRRGRGHAPRPAARRSPTGVAGRPAGRARRRRPPGPRRGAGGGRPADAPSTCSGSAGGGDDRTVRRSATPAWRAPRGARRRRTSTAPPRRRPTSPVTSRS